MRNDAVSQENAMNQGLMRPMASKSIVDRIIQRLTGAILAGDLKPGQKIPTETELSESMQVGRNSVREAIKALETMGVLNIRRSEGTFVAEGFSERMMAPMLYGMVLEGGNTYALVELRRLIETGILQLAITKATAEDIRSLQGMLAAMRGLVQTGPDAEALQEADIAFHEALKEAVHNPLVDKFYSIIEQLSRPTRILAMRQFMEKGELEQMLFLHEEILRIIVEKDEASVSQAIDAHFRYWTTNMQ